MKRDDLQKKLDAVNAFMSSPAYPALLEGYRTELSGIEAGILNVAPSSMETIATLNHSHGIRQSVLANIQYFEVLREDLKTAIAKCEEADNQFTQPEE